MLFFLQNLMNQAATVPEQLFQSYECCAVHERRLACCIGKKRGSTMALLSPAQCRLTAISIPDLPICFGRARGASCDTPIPHCDISPRFHAIREVGTLTACARDPERRSSVSRWRGGRCDIDIHLIASAAAASIGDFPRVRVFPYFSCPQKCDGSGW